MTEEIFRSIEAAECVEWIWCDVVRKLLTFDILIFWSHCRMCADLRWEQTIISALAPERMLSSAFGATHEIFAKSLSPLLRQTRNSVSTEIRRNYYSSHLWISSEICGRSHKTAQMVRWDSSVEITLILFADCGRQHSITIKSVRRCFWLCKVLGPLFFPHVIDLGAHSNVERESASL